MTHSTMINLLTGGLLASLAVVAVGVFCQSRVNKSARNNEAQEQKQKQGLALSAYPIQAVRREQTAPARVLGSTLPGVLKEDFTPAQWQTFEDLKAWYRSQESRTWAEGYIKGVKERRGQS